MSATQRASILIPAHNEGQTIARLLRSLAAAARSIDLEVIVACNGCTDDTAQRARSALPQAIVIETAIASKQHAVGLADAIATVYPRVICDADVELLPGSIDALVEPLVSGEVLASAPHRRLPKDHCSWPVRWYYDFWEALPQVRSGIFGRGVIAMNAAGCERFRTLPPVMSDDLAISEAFAPRERTVVSGASVIVRPPGTVSDLVRRRIRVATGNAQADALKARSVESRTSWASIASMLRTRPELTPKAFVFLAVAISARLGAQRYIRSGDVTTWLRDESSRRG